MDNYKQRAQELVSRMTLEEKCSQMRYNAPAIERLGIPAYNWWNECLHGVGRAGAATVFPQAIGMAASFNTGLIHQVATAISDEARAKYNQYKTFGETEIYQGLTYWSPNINMFRDPRWGRGHETYGEDPFLTGEIGCAFIRGLQGDDPTHRKLDATIKHYAVHSGPESQRHSFDAVVSEQDLKEYYMWAFKYCIDHANPAAVMGAYNKINGEAACASPTYLKGRLYGDYGFKGYVVSDCGAIADIHNHHKLTANTAESAALAINNGCTLCCGKDYESMMEAVQQGLLSEETITHSAEQLIEARLRLGLLSSSCVYDTLPYETVESEKHLQLSRKTAEESIVLLKNNGVLPLSKKQKIAVVGPNADDRTILLGNYNGTPSESITLLMGLREKAPGQSIYARGCHIYDPKSYPWAEQPMREALIAAQHSDVVVMCMGLNPSMEGEEGDAYNGAASGDKTTIELPESQLNLLAEINKMGKPIVFVNVSGSCVNLTPAAQVCAAVLQVFYPGTQGGRALANILYGDANPNGALPVTFFSCDADLPPFTQYSLEGRSYQYFKGTPLYPFGFGLSYTNFGLKNSSIEQGKVHAKVENTGHKAGKCVVQLYARDQTDPHVNRRLAAFTKVELAPGACTEISLIPCPEIMELFTPSATIRYELYLTGDQRIEIK